jgi:protein phosphatase
MPDLEQSIASNQAKSDEQMQNTGLSFIAPASEEIGGEINVAVLVNGFGPESDTLGSFVAEAIRQSFLASPTKDPFEAISNALKRANAAVIARRSTLPDQAVTGCSATIALIAVDRLFVGNVGDNRVYLFREEETETLAADHTWVQEALQAWRVRPGEIQDHSSVSLPSQYLGKDEAISPRLAPIEFLWPGDILLLCTAGLGQLRDNEIHDIVTSSSPREASHRLVESALDRGAESNLTSLVLKVPQDASAPDVMPTPGRRVVVPSPSAIALVLGNLLLICLVVGVLLGGASFLSPSQPVEVAKPAFETATATPTAGLDVDPAQLTPTVPSSSPVAAPTLAPAQTATPLPAPTFTPQPSPDNWVSPPPPPLLRPTDGFVFSGLQSDVVLEWGSAGSMPEDVFYVVSIKKWVNGTYVGESQNWTKSNRIRLDSSFYTAFNQGPRRFANAAPNLAGSVNQFEWSVTIYRLTLIKPDGTLQGVPLNSTSPARNFTWGPALPTRVYGG